VLPKVKARPKPEVPRPRPYIPIPGDETYKTLSLAALKPREMLKIRPVL